MATVNALRALGIAVRTMPDGYAITGSATLCDPGSPIDCANSGTTMRLLMGLLAGRVNATLDGDASLRRRPMARVAQPLTRMGAPVTTNAGHAPVRIRRTRLPLHAISYRLPVASAQVKSALLLAALVADGCTTIVEPARSRNHTEILLRSMGARLRVRDRTIRIDASPLVTAGRVRVPGDLSSGVYLLCAAAVLPGTILTLRDVGINSTRTAALDVLAQMGTAVRQTHRRSWCGEAVADLQVRGGSGLHNVTVAKHRVAALIDEIPALCALATTASGTFVVRGAAELKVKESNRIATTVELLRSFGADAQGLPDGIVVQGGQRLHAPRAIATHGDHRVGLAAAILAAATKMPLRIDDSACLATSFPGFVKVWRAAF